MAVTVATRESGLQMVQSRHLYPGTSNREQSFCIFQIHEPAHTDLIAESGLHDFKTNVESCVALARLVYERAGYSFSPWTEYHKLLAKR